MEYKIYKTEVFVKLFDSLELNEKKWIEKIITQLKNNSAAGKPLRFPWFREKKFEGKRLYFLVYDDLKKILLVSFGNKKDQQKIIDAIVEDLKSYRELAKKL